MSTNKIKNGWMDLKDASEYSSLSKSTLNRSINRGLLKSSKITGKTLVKIEWIDRFLEGHSGH